MNIAERVQEVFNRFNVNLTVTDNVELENKETKTDLAEATLDNGTVIYTDADSFAEGVEAYLSTTKAKISLCLLASTPWPIAV